MAVIFVSVASKGCANGGSLTSAFLEDFAKMHDRFPEHSFICPVIQGYTILPYLEDLIQAADSVWVMLTLGWENPTTVRDAAYNTSEGVEQELLLARTLQKPITFYNPN